ncbi:T-cell receptor beta chain C region isoform X1 [Oryzias latipes]
MSSRKATNRRKAGLSRAPVRCASGAAEAVFGRGTKLTVLGKKPSSGLEGWDASTSLGGKCLRFRDGEAAGRQKDVNLTQFQSSIVPFSCCREGFTVSFQSEAFFGSGTKLTVLESGINVTAPTRVKVLSPSEKECSSGKKTLVCVASGFYPDHVSVSWMINEETVSKGVATDSAATRYGTSYRITSRLTVSSEEWTSDIKFVCSVSFFNGTTTTYHNDSITGEAKKSPSGTELSRDKYLRITQSAKLSYIIFIVKSCIYGAFIWFVAWKLQSLAEKKRKR